MRGTAEYHDAIMATRPVSGLAAAPSIPNLRVARSASRQAVANALAWMTQLTMSPAASRLRHHPAIAKRCHTLLMLTLLPLVLAGCSSQPTTDTTPSPTTQGTPASRTMERGPIKATVEVDHDAVAIPEPITLTLTVEAERGVEVIMPEFTDLLGPFGIQKIDKAEPTQDDLYRREKWTLTLEPFLPGTQSIPPMTIAYIDARERADGSTAEIRDSIDSAELPVTVSQTLADIKPPIAIDAPTSLTLLYWALGVIAAVALVALIARRLRRGIDEDAPVAPIVPAHVWALSQLDMLAAEGLIERGRVQEWYYRINAIARQYIERRYGLMAGEQTSEEFLRDLQRSPQLAPKHKEMLQQFVSACDPVKYARHLPGPDDIRWVETSARAFVLETAQAPETTPTPDILQHASHAPEAAS